MNKFELCVTPFWAPAVTLNWCLFLEKGIENLAYLNAIDSLSKSVSLGENGSINSTFD